MTPRAGMTESDDSKGVAMSSMHRFGLLAAGLLAAGLLAPVAASAQPDAPREVSCRRTTT